MEYYENTFFEEMLALRSDPMEMGMNNDKNDAFYCNPSVWSEENTILDCIPPSSFDDFSNCLPFDHDQSLITPSSPFFNDELYTPQFTHFPAPPFQCNNKEDIFSSSSSSIFDELWQNGSFNIGSFPIEDEKKPKSKKVNGQPSKNLMAERRRRKRLNDRLSMLRSIVPKISRMDRTAILGDTIDYMKELQERIKQLQEEMEVGPDELRLMSIFNDVKVKPDEMALKNLPKIEVESKRRSDTRVEICCSAKPGLLLSTVTTLEALGLEIQQCVISCFNDFAMRASCTEEMEKSGGLNSEEVKEALFRNAGYGGRRL